MLATHGAKVVVNDMGGSADGMGDDQTPAEEVVATIKSIEEIIRFSRKNAGIDRDTWLDV